MRKIYAFSLLLLLSSGLIWGQCNILPNAVAGLILDYQSTNLLNCSGVGFNPIMGRYYAVRAGNPSFPLETWTSTGTQLYTTSAGFDWRGMWWNPNTNQLEGNGYFNTGLWRADINGSGYALSTGATLFTGMAQPDAQSCGDYDYAANEIVYYFNGRIYRYSRTTNAALGNYALTGCPVAFSSINSTTVVYTGCLGKEIGILDYVNKRIYLFNKSNGAYVGTSQLPNTAVTNASFRFSYANGLAWLFDLGTGNWFSYRILDVILPANHLSANTIWLSDMAIEVDWESDTYDQFSGFEVERGVDGVNFTSIGAKDASEISGGNDASHQWAMQDATLPDAPVIYYRVKGLTKAGEEIYSEVMAMTRNASSDAALQAWPVPADKAIHLRLENLPSGSKAEVLDASGRLVAAQDLSASSQVHEFDCSTWADGVYLLRIAGANGSLATQRLVVRH
ncbi:MAG: T9SS type A sorting domain-containing protein [Bacteroidia bacterium]